MKEEDNPLRSLVGEEELNREKLLQILDPYLRFDEDGNIVYRPTFEELSSKDRILLYLLARKALYDLGMAHGEGSSPSSIAEEININGNTVRSALSRLKSRGLVKSGKAALLSDSTSYQVPNSVLEEVKGRLDE